MVVSLYSSGTWKVKKSALGKNKEVFDAELWGIYLVLQEIRLVCGNASEVMVFMDLKRAAQRVWRQVNTPGQVIMAVIYERAK